MQQLHSICEIRAIVNPIAKEYGAERVFLFGSYARGDAHPGSDADLRIDKGTIRWLRFAGMLGDLQDALGTSVDHTITWNVVEDDIPALREYCNKIIDSDE